MIPIDSTLIDTRIGTGFGITALPHIQDVTIQGPLARDRRVGHAQPAAGVLVPADLAG